MNAGRRKQNITVLIANNFKNLKIPKARLIRLVKMICGRFKIADATVGISIMGDAGIKRVNRKFFNRAATTDCISFDLSEDMKTPGTRVFDIAVNAEMAVRQTKLRAHSSEAELALYITHGLLHNIGFDDLKPRAAKRMHKTEDEILRQFGYGTVYNKRSKTE